MNNGLRKALGLPVSAVEVEPVTSPAETPPAPGGAAARSDQRQTLGSIELVQEAGRERWGRRFLRGLFITVLVLLLFIGVRTLVRPAAQAAPLVIPAAVTYDRSGAQAVAARWATAYLSLAPGDAAKTARSAELGLDAAAGIDTTGGVAVSAAQSVLSVLPATVTVAADGTSSVVTVLARVATGAGSKAVIRWVALAVPVGTDGVRPVVTAAGAFVAFSAPGGAGTPPAATDADTALATATRSAAQAWFAAFGGSDAAALAAISAPGATQAPAGGLGLKSLDAWSVANVGSTTRQAVATVTWTTPAGDVQQRYSLVLSAVRSGATTDWRVLSATATATR